MCRRWVDDRGYAAVVGCRGSPSGVVAHRGWASAIAMFDGEAKAAGGVLGHDVMMTGEEMNSSCRVED